MADMPIDPSLIESDNAKRRVAFEADYAALGEQLERRGLSIEAVVEAIRGFKVAVPSWGVGTGGTRP